MLIDDVILDTKVEFIAFLCSDRKFTGFDDSFCDDLNLALSEAKTLEQYSDQTGRSQTDIIRELIRELPEKVVN